MPQLVNQAGNKAETLNLDYVSLVPVLVKAIQEQQSELKEQRDALKQKDAEIAALNARLTALEQTMEQLSAPQMAKAQK